MPRRAASRGVVAIEIVLLIAFSSIAPGSALASDSAKKAACPPAGPTVKPPRPSGTGPKVLRDREAGLDCLKPITKQQQPDTTTEPSLAVNPQDPLNAVAVYQEGRVDSGCSEAGGFATTFDGGKTWRHGDLPGLTVATGGSVALASDYVVAFGPNDLVYANSLLCGEGGLAVNVSKDGGAHWGDPVVLGVDAYSPLVDKNWIVVDNSQAAGHHFGRVYIVWDNVAPVFATYSDDEGLTWQPPSIVYLGAGIGSIPLVMPNGDLAVVFAASGYPLPPVHRNPADYQADLVAATEKEVVAVAHGAGSIPTGSPLIFAPPLTVGSYAGQDVRRQRAGEGLPTAAVDPGTGRIYVAWEDARFRTDLANDVVITWSDDEGLTWPVVRKVNPGHPDDYVDHFTPALAVGPDGSVRISYRVQYEAASVSAFSPFVDTYYQQSNDGGQTFTRPLKVNSIPTDVRFATFSRESAFLGDYSQVGVAGPLTYIVRCEAFSLSKQEKRTFPPSVYHQRTWVAVVSS